MSLAEPMTEECAPGVFRLGTTYVGFYLLERDDKYTLVDSGLPGYWGQLVRFLESRGRSIEDIEAHVLTHHHIDHRGSSERVRREARAEVRIHEIDAPHLDAQPSPPKAPIWRIPVLRYVAHLVKNGTPKTEPVASFSTFEDGEVLDVPGAPRAVLVPGHTMGHCCMYLERQRVLITGDALAGMDLLTGAVGPRIAPSFTNDDTELALKSLSRIAALDADRLLVVHGPNWEGPVSDAVAQARAAAVQ